MGSISGDIVVIAIFAFCFKLHNDICILAQSPVIKQHEE